MHGGQGLAGCYLGLVGVGWEELALDVVLGLGGVAWLKELEQLSEALIFHYRHWLQITHNHLSYSLRDQNLTWVMSIKLGQPSPRASSYSSLKGCHSSNTSSSSHSSTDGVSEAGISSICGETVQETRGVTLSLQILPFHKVIIHSLVLPLEMRYEVGRDTPLRLDPGTTSLAVGLDFAIFTFKHNIKVIQNRHLRN